MNKCNVNIFLWILSLSFSSMSFAVTSTGMETLNIGRLTSPVWVRNYEGTIFRDFTESQLTVELNQISGNVDTAIQPNYNLSYADNMDNNFSVKARFEVTGSGAGDWWYGPKLSINWQEGSTNGQPGWYENYVIENSNISPNEMHDWFTNDYEPDNPQNIYLGQTAQDGTVYKHYRVYHNEWTQFWSVRQRYRTGVGTSSLKPIVNFWLEHGMQNKQIDSIRINIEAADENYRTFVFSDWCIPQSFYDGSCYVSNGEVDKEDIVESVSFSEPQVTYLDSNGIVTVNVDYSVAGNRDIALEVFTKDWGWLGVGTVDVSRGQGTTSITVQAGQLTEDDYRLKLALRPDGGHYSDAYLPVSKMNLPVGGALTNAMNFLSVPNEIDLSGDISVDVNYESSFERDLVLEIFDIDWNFLVGETKRVTAGKGQATLGLRAGTLAPGNYNLKVSMRSAGGDWMTSVKDLYQNIEAVGSSESLSFTAPEVTSLSADGDVSVQVEYSAAGERDIVLEIFDENWNWLRDAKVDVGPGSNTVAINLAAGQLAEGVYHLKVAMRPDNGVWDTAYNADYRTNLPVQVAQTPEFEFISVPSAIGLNGEVSVQVSYASDQNVDLALEIFDAQWNWIKSSVETVNGGSGNRTLSVSAGALTPGTYQLKASMREVGGDWRTSLIDLYSTVEAN